MSPQQSDQETLNFWTMGHQGIVLLSPLTPIARTVVWQTKVAHLPAPPPNLHGFFPYHRVGMADAEADRRLASGTIRTNRLHQTVSIKFDGGLSRLEPGTSWLSGRDHGTPQAERSERLDYTLKTGRNLWAPIARGYASTLNKDFNEIFTNPYVPETPRPGTQDWNSRGEASGQESGWPPSAG